MAIKHQFEKARYNYYLASIYFRNSTYIVLSNAL